MTQTADSKNEPWVSLATALQTANRLESMRYDLVQGAYFTPEEDPTWDATEQGATAIRQLVKQIRDRRAVGWDMSEKIELVVDTDGGNWAEVKVRDVVVFRGHEDEARAYVLDLLNIGVTYNQTVDGERVHARVDDVRENAWPA